MLIEEIVVRVGDDGLDLVIRWAGDDHTALRVRKNRTGEHTADSTCRALWQHRGDGRLAYDFARKRLQGHRRQRRSAKDHVRSLFGDHDRWRIGVAGWHERHDRGVDNPDAEESTHLEIWHNNGIWS